MSARWWWVVFCTGCAHHHLETNAPGNIDVHEPPPDRAQRELVEPEDPGENMAVLAYNGFGSVGLSTDDGSFAYAAGGEIGGRYGGSPRSHNDDDFVILPLSAYGLNLGWSALTSTGTELGPVYGELEYSSLIFGIAGGYAWDIDDASSGPQVTVSAGPLYGRVTFVSGDGAQLLVGLMIGGSQTWVWSR